MTHENVISREIMTSRKVLIYRYPRPPIALTLPHMGGGAPLLYIVPPLFLYRI